MSIELELRNLGVDVDALLRDHPTPLLAYWGQRIVDNARRARAAFGAQNRVMFSYKACYVPRVLQLIHGQGVDAEVCSAREASLALAAGTAPARICWNAVSLSDSDAKMAASADIGLLGLNTVDDIRRLDAAAREADKVVDVQLRLYPSGTKSAYLKRGTRLGFDTGDVTAMKAVETALAASNLRLVGVHSHTQVHQHDATLLLDAYRASVDFARDVERATGATLQSIGIGGGLEGVGELRRGGTSVGEIGAALVLEQRDLAPDLQLTVEPGRYFVDDAAWAFTSVLSSVINDGSEWWIVDMGSHVLLPFGGRAFPMEALHGIGPARAVSIGDRLSTYNGVMVERCELPHVAVGGVLVAKDVGAYTESARQVFMFGRPEIVVFEGDGATTTYPAESDEQWAVDAVSRGSFTPPAKP